MDVMGWACISDDGLYRYELIREWEQFGSRMVFIMLNPSTADAAVDDPTIRRCMGFARREGCGGIKVYNLFALRVTRPVHLFDKTIADDPNGVANYGYVSDALDVASEWKDRIVVAWGAFPKASRSDVYNLLCQRDVLCLGKTADGSPRHPLYVKAGQPLMEWA
jgi:hypothetical protein